MKENPSLNYLPFFEELSLRFGREHIEYETSEDDRLTVLLNGQEVGFVTPGGAMRVKKDSLDDQEARELYHRAGSIASEVHEYVKLMKNAPPLKASSHSGPYRLLADFNGYVLGGVESKQGVQFATWAWTYDKTGLAVGHYCGNDYAAAKNDFAVRSGLVREEKQFSVEQLVEIYRCCADTLSHDYELTYEQERRLEDIQAHISEKIPDFIERLNQSLESDASQQMQQTM